MFILHFVCLTSCCPHIDQILPKSPAPYEGWAGIPLIEASWNVMAHAQKPDFVCRRNVRVHLNRRGRQFSRLLAAEVCASAVVILYTPCSEVVWRVLATYSIRQFLLHIPPSASPRVITFQLDCTLYNSVWTELTLTASCSRVITEELMVAFLASKFHVQHGDQATLSMCD